MTRRNAAWMIARAAAATAAPEFLSAWMNHDSGNIAPPEPDRWANYQPKFFSPQELKILDAFTAILIPSDDTPGAREAHVVPFIDFVVTAAAEYEPELQDDWRTALHFLDQHNFAGLSPAGQAAFIEKMSQPPDAGFETYHLIKDMAVHAFYTSRVGLIDVLEYKGNAYLTQFPGCTHSEHHEI